MTLHVDFLNELMKFEDQFTPEQYNFILGCYHDENWGDIQTLLLSLLEKDYNRAIDYIFALTPSQRITNDYTIP